MEQSGRLGLPLLVPGQGQKDITHNEALVLLDMLVQPSVESRSLRVPPEAPLVGQCWLVPEAAAGEWADCEGQLVQWSEAGWRRAFVPEGCAIWVAEEAQLIRKVNGKFRLEGLGSVPQPSVAVAADGLVADKEARAAVQALITRLQQAGLLQEGP